MQTIDRENAESYLRSQGLLAIDEQVAVRELTGGVSNVVLLVSRSAPGADFVLKQARPQLRVADPWFCSVERIWREVEVIQICNGLLDQQPATAGLQVHVPTVLYCDRDNYLFTMTAAPSHHVWKQQLLDGATEPAVATACGRLLGLLHAGTWQHHDVAATLDDRTFFADLRVDPYYRHVARQREDLRSALEQLCCSLDQQRWALVHGDFSPKNLLVFEGGLLLLDFEVGHYGDPAFDLGFFLSHLVIKAIYAGPQASAYLELTRRFWQSYEEQLRPMITGSAMDDLRQRGVTNWAACMLARVDGKSPVEYLEACQQEIVRQLGCRMLVDPPENWDQVLDEIGASFRRGL